MVWKDLTDVSKANILESIAGKRNANVATALIENFEKAEEVLATSSTAAGSALEENEKYLESINGKISIMKATFEDMSRSIIDSEIVAVFVDISTVLLEILNSLAKINALIPSVLTSIGSIQGLGMLKSNKSGAISFLEGIATSDTDDLVKAFQSLSSVQQSGIMNILQNPELFERLDGVSGELELKAENLATALFELGYAGDDAGSKINDFSDVISDVVSKSDGFKKSIKNIWSSMNVLGKASVIAAGLMAVYSIVKAIADYRNHASERLYEEATSIKDEYDELGEDISSKTEEVSTNQKRILELKDKLSAGTITFVEEQELNNLEETNKQLEYILQTKKELQELESQEYNDTLVESFDKKKYSMSKADDGIIDAIRGSYQRQIQELIDEQARIYSDDTLSNVEKEVRRNALQSEIDLLTQQNEQLKLSSFTQEEYLQLLVDTRNELDVIRQKNGVLTEEQLNHYNSIEKELRSILIDVNDNYLEKYIGEGVGKDQFQAVVDYIRGVLDPAGEVERALDGIEDKPKQIMKNLGDKGLLTAERVEELAEEFTLLGNVISENELTFAEVANYFNAISLASNTLAASAHDSYKELFALEEELKRLSNNGGKVDLVNRKVIYYNEDNIDNVRSWPGFKDATTGTNDYSTVSSQIFGDANGMELVVTPILPDGTTLDQKTLENYVDEIIGNAEKSGSNNYAAFDKYGILMGVFDNTDDAIAFGDAVHKLHEETKLLNDELAKIDTEALLASVTDVEPVYKATEKYAEIHELIAVARSEMDESGNVSIDTIEKLSGLTDDYTKFLEIENGVVRLNIDALNEYADISFDDNTRSIKANIAALKEYRDRMLNMPATVRLNIDSDKVAADIDLFERLLDLYEAAYGNLDDTVGLEGLENSLKASNKELERADYLISKIIDGDFENTTAQEFTELIGIMPSVKNDLEAYAIALKNATNENDKIAAQTKLFKNLNSAVRSYKAEKMADALDDVAEAATRFGRDSYQVQNAIQALNQYSPTLVGYLYDEETGLLKVGEAAEYTAEALLTLASIDLGKSIISLNRQINTVKSSGFMDNHASGPIIQNYLQNELEAQKSLLEEEQSLWKEVMGSVVNVGGGSSSTLADKINESFDSLNSSLEHSIFLQQQYYKDAEESLDSQAMRASLLKQIEYYQRIQEEAHKAAEQLRAYYRSQGLTAAQIEMQSDIQDLSKTWWAAADSIEEATKSIYEDITKAFSDSVDEIQKVYDTLHDAADEYAESGYITVDVLQDIVDMGVEYLAFLQDENGQLVINEERIQDIIKARTEQMAVESALSYVEAVRAAKQANNIEELNRLLYATQDATGATWGLVYATLAMAGLSDNEYNAALNTVNSLRALANSAVESIGKTAEKTSDVLKDMQNGVDDILKYVMDMIRHEVESQVEALEDLKDSYSDLIELKKESLEATKDESNYTEQVAELTQKIAKLQSDIDLLDLVGTRESEAQKAALLEEQTELQKELANLQGDYAYDAQVDALDKMEEAYHDSKDREIELLENTISSEEKLYRLALERIETQWDSLYKQLIDWNYSYGNSLQKDLENAWSNALAAAQRYGSFVSALNSLPGDIEAAGSSSPNYIVGNTFTDTSYSNEEAIQSIIGIMRKNAAAWHGASTEQQKNLEAQNEALATQLSAFGLNLHKANGIWYLDDGRKLFEVYPNYHTGGIVGGGTPKENEEFALLKKKEWVLTEGMVDGLLKKLSLFDKVGAVVTKLTDIMSQAYRPGVGNLIRNDPPSYFSENNGRSVQVSIGDTYITGANEDTIKQHQQINKRFMDDLATQLGVRW